jgi:hypothetical protein
LFARWGEWIGTGCGHGFVGDGDGDGNGRESTVGIAGVDGPGLAPVMVAYA